MEDREPYEWFERVVCISLDRRPDRWAAFQKHIDSCDWPFKPPERFSAIDGMKCVPPKVWRIGNGAWGCYRSHIRLLEDVLQSGTQSVLILEDDAEPLPQFADRVRQWQTGIPSNWQGLWFGGEHTMQSESVSERVTQQTLKCRFATRTHCFGLRQPFLSEFYRYLVDFKVQIENASQHIDHAIARYMAHGKHALYAPAKGWLVAQAEAKSDITNKHEPKRMFQ